MNDLVFSVTNGLAPGPVYDGFISYSHAADDLLAPRLQAALQRFAKPWWKRRALRLFRDEASLSANPHLWSSVIEALDSSEWFILLLSPEAARSEWVDREVAWWLEHKDPTRIVPVLTDGEFGWSAGIISDAAPPSLYGAFDDEPRWVDLRFARSEVQLDLKNPLFADAVADLASPLRGVPKDELASEEVKQHRRTMRTAWAAGIALTVVSVAAVVFGIQADQQRTLAEANETLAQQRAEEEQKAREEADAQRERAEAGEARAEFEAAVSRMRALIAYSTAEIGNDPELATLLALMASSVAPEQRYELQALPQLQDAIAANRLLARFDSPADSSVIPYPYNNGVLSADGSTVYASQMLGQGGRVVAIDIDTGSVVETYYHSDSTDPPRWVAISAEGLLAFDVAPEEPGSVGELWVVDTVTGETTSFSLSGCHEIAVPLRFSDDGRYLTYTDGTPDCREGQENDWAVVLDTATWEEFLRWEKLEAEGENIQIGLDSTVALMTSCGTLEQGCLHELVDFPSLNRLQNFVGFTPNLSTAGDRLVYWDLLSGAAFGTTRIVDLQSGDAVTIEDDASRGWVVSGEWPFALSEDGLLLAVMASPFQRSAEGVTHTVLVVDADSGSLVASLPRLPTTPRGDQAFYGLSWSANGERLLTSDYQGLRLWDVAPITVRTGLAEIEDPVELALEILTRGFTQAECSRYALDSCPTLEELREG